MLIARFPRTEISVLSTGVSKFVMTKVEADEDVDPGGFTSGWCALWGSSTVSLSSLFPLSELDGAMFVGGREIVGGRAGITTARIPGVGVWAGVGVCG